MLIEEIQHRTLNFKTDYSKIQTYKVYIIYEPYPALGNGYQQDPLFPHVQNQTKLKLKPSVFILRIYISNLIFHVISHLISMHGLQLKNALMHVSNYMSVNCFFELMASFQCHSQVQRLRPCLFRTKLNSLRCFYSSSPRTICFLGI